MIVAGGYMLESSWIYGYMKSGLMRDGLMIINSFRNCWFPTFMTSFYLAQAWLKILFFSIKQQPLSFHLIAIN